MSKRERIQPARPTIQPQATTNKPDNTPIIVPCCPQLITAQSCDVLTYQYRLLYPVTLTTARTRQTVSVEVIITARLERCPGPLALGDLMYSTTILPGEKVRLFTTDRNSQFTYDSESKQIYRQEQTRGEDYYMSSMDEFMTDITARDEAHSTNTTRGQSDSHGSTSGILKTIFGSPSVNVRGTYDAESTSDFMRELTQHAQGANNRCIEATRTVGSVTIGEVQTTTHQEGEVQEKFEATTREFSNPNKCHAVTYYFYQINKTQTIKFSITSVQTRVIDPVADTKVTNNEFSQKGDVSTIPSPILATNLKRLEIENMAKQSVTQQHNAQTLTRNVRLSSMSAVSNATMVSDSQPISLNLRRQALATVNSQLSEAGLIESRTGEITKKTQEFSFEVHTTLPTPGFLVKGCLDQCDVCEDARKREIVLDLENKRLQNELLKRQIELLDKAQEYRCCPVNTEETTPST